MLFEDFAPGPSRRLREVQQTKENALLALLVIGAAVLTSHLFLANLGRVLSALG